MGGGGNGQEHVVEAGAVGGHLERGRGGLLEPAQELEDLAGRALGGHVDGAQPAVRAHRVEAAERTLVTGQVENCSRTTSAPSLAFSSSGVPRATTRPWSSTATVSASWSASSRYWVVSRTVTPSSTRRRTVLHICSRLRGSSPVVGSSRNTRGGRAIMLMARSRRRRIPPEYLAARRSAASARPNSASSSRARVRAARPGQAQQLGHHLQVLPAGQLLVHGRVLPGEADRPLDPERIGEQVVPGDGRGPRVGAHQGGQDPDHRGLARAVRAEQGQHGPGPDRQVHVIQDGVSAEGLAHTLGCNCVCHTR